MSEPILKVVDADGNVLHDCAAAGCEVSWDGYNISSGDRVEGATDPGDEWDTSRPGIAKLKPTTE